MACGSIVDAARIREVWSVVIRRGPKTGVYWTFVYFVQSSDPPYLVKIGMSIQPTKRLASLICSSPTPLRTIFLVAANVAAEELLHFAFEDIRAHGEWFYPHPNLKSLVRAWKGAGVTLLTPNIMEATLPKMATNQSITRRGLDLSVLLAYYRQAFKVDSRDGDGRRANVSALEVFTDGDVEFS